MTIEGKEGNEDGFDLVKRMQQPQQSSEEGLAAGLLDRPDKVTVESWMASAHGRSWRTAVSSFSISCRRSWWDESGGFVASGRNGPDHCLRSVQEHSKL